MPKINVHHDLIRNASWNAIAILLTRGTLFLSMLITARILSKSEFGELGIIQSSISMFETVAAFGMAITAAKHVAEYRKTNPEKIARIVSFTNLSALIMGIIFATILFILAPWLATHNLNNPGLSNKLQIAAAIVGFNVLISVQNGILVGFEDFKTMAIANFFSGLITLASIVYGTYSYGVVGTIYGLLTASFISSILNTFLVYRKLFEENIRIDLSVTRDEYRLIWTFSVPSMLSGLMFTPVNWLAASMLVNQVNGYDHMGIFNAANQWFSILLFIPGVLTNTLLPKFADKASKHDMIELRTIVWKAVKLLLSIVIPLSLLIAISSPIIMKAYGNEYESGSSVLTIISIAASLTAIQNLLGNGLAAINRMWIHTACNLSWSIVYLSSAYYFIHTSMYIYADL